MVATYQELDGRILKDIERIKWLNEQPTYSFADELEKKNKEAEAKREAAFSEQIKMNAEELAFAMRKDLGMKTKIAVSKDISGE